MSFVDPDGDGLDFGDLSNFANVANAGSNARIANALQAQAAAQRSEAARIAALPQCPVCGGRIEQGFRKCSHCRADLAWVGPWAYEAGDTEREKQLQVKLAELQKRAQQEQVKQAEKERVRREREYAINVLMQQPGVHPVRTAYIATMAAMTALLFMNYDVQNIGHALGMLFVAALTSAFLGMIPACIAYFYYRIRAARVVDNRKQMGITEANELEITPPIITWISTLPASCFRWVREVSAVTPREQMGIAGVNKVESAIPPPLNRSSAVVTPPSRENREATQVGKPLPLAANSASTQAVALALIVMKSADADAIRECAESLADKRIVLDPRAIAHEVTT